MGTCWSSLSAQSAWRAPQSDPHRSALPVYRLTAKGLDALREYAQPPVTFPPVKSDALLRLLICDLVGEQVTREGLATLRDEVADIAKRLDDAERRAKEFPHREKYLLLVVGFLRQLLELHEQLVEDVERELA